MQKLYQENRARGLELLAINVIGGVDPLNGDEAARRLVLLKGWTFPILSGDEQVLEPVLSGYGVRGLPANFLVDREGRLPLEHDYWGEEGLKCLGEDVEAILAGLG